MSDGLKWQIEGFMIDVLWNEEYLQYRDSCEPNKLLSTAYPLYCKANAVNHAQLYS